MTADRPEALNRIKCRAVDQISVSIDDCFDRAPGDSPIEKLFVVSLFAMTAFPNTPAAVPLIFGQNGASGPSPDVRTDCLYVVPQFTLLGRRVDFVIWAHDGRSWRRLLIECDGHEFHERTKEQAATDRRQDRKFQQAGETVFRFTGSEIVNEPDRCAYDVLRWADSIGMGDAA